MKKNLISFSLVIALLSVANTSMAQVNKRQAKQNARVNQGRASGEITAKEAAQIQHKQNEVQAMENAARSDGKVTKAERKAINHEQNEASRQIACKKSNRRDRN